MNEQFEIYKEQLRKERPLIHQKYNITGFIASGTYGRVYFANKNGLLYAIKKFKPEKLPIDPSFILGISQSAMREITLCKEIQHKNLVKLSEVMVEPFERSIYLIFDYAEHDLLQILHHHSVNGKNPIPLHMIQSLMFQLIRGVEYLHANWILHRDLKPANILVQSNGTVKIADLGLARIFHRPLQPLFNGDRVIVTIWYRAPELLLGTRHYTKAIDIWAIGCIFGELLTLRPIFKGEEAKIENKKQIPFQKNQMMKILDVLGTPSLERWPSVIDMPEYNELSQLITQIPDRRNLLGQFLRQSCPYFTDEQGFDLMNRMLEYDPQKRISAAHCLQHLYFISKPVSEDAFLIPETGKRLHYPARKISKEEKDLTEIINSSSNSQNPPSIASSSTQRKRIRKK